MPTLKSSFVDDPLNFMSRHGISIKAAGSTDAHLTGMGPFTGAWTDAERGSRVSLTAPSGVATFKETIPRKQHPAITCSAALVDLNVSPRPTTGAPLGEETIPVYVIPYSGNHGMGIKLPSGAEDAYAITTKINGCTFAVSGTRAEPYCSHTNVSSVGEDEKTDAVRQHVQMMADKFRAAELAAGGDDTQVGVGRSIFNLHDWPVDARASAVVNYANFAQQRVQMCIDTGTHVISDHSATFSHDKYYVKLTAESQNFVLDSCVPTSNAVIGVRKAGQWTFYFSHYASLHFDVRKQHKVGGSVRSDTTSVWQTYVVLTHGEIWPNKHVYTRPFFPDAYELPGTRPVV